MIVKSSSGQVSIPKKEILNDEFCVSFGVLIQESYSVLLIAEYVLEA